MVLQYWGYNVSLQDVANKVFYGNETTMSSMVGYESNFVNLSIQKAPNGLFYINKTQTLIFNAFTGNISMLKTYVDNGVPVIVCQNFSFTDTTGHFRVVIGYTNQSLIVIDPDYGRYQISYDNFVALWLIFFSDRDSHFKFPSLLTTKTGSSVFIGLLC